MEYKIVHFYLKKTRNLKNNLKLKKMTENNQILKHTKNSKTVNGIL